MSSQSFASTWHCWVDALLNGRSRASGSGQLKPDVGHEKLVGLSEKVRPLHLLNARAWVQRGGTSAEGRGCYWAVTELDVCGSLLLALMRSLAGLTFPTTLKPARTV
jgi:hypothetical protein